MAVTAVSVGFFHIRGYHKKTVVEYLCCKLTYNFSFILFSSACLLFLLGQAFYEKLTFNFSFILFLNAFLFVLGQAFDEINV